jgi:molybdate transport system ATP-binding protein
VSLNSGSDRLLARITRRSAARMGLVVGQEVHAIIKATAVAAQDIGGAA